MSRGEREEVSRIADMSSIHSMLAYVASIVYIVSWHLSGINRQHSIHSMMAYIASIVYIVCCYISGIYRQHSKHSMLATNKLKELHQKSKNGQHLH